jgi:hypothetical protein
VRLVLSASLIGLFCASWADDSLFAELLVAQALRNLAEAPSAMVTVTGESRSSTGSVPFELRAWREGIDKFRIESISGEGKQEKLLIVADGKYVWRWDDQRREYAVVEQPSGLANTLSCVQSLAPGTAAAPLRFLVGYAPMPATCRYELQATDTTKDGSAYTVRCAQTGEEYVFTIRMPATGMPVLQAARHAQVRNVGRSRVTVTSQATFPTPETAIPGLYRFTPPPGARGVSGFEGGR